MEKHEVSTDVKRRQLKENYQPWTSESDFELREMYEKGIPLGDIAMYFGRTKGAIYSRLKKIHFEE
jgi:hypothetical protein